MEPVPDSVDSILVPSSKVALPGQKLPTIWEIGDEGELVLSLHPGQGRAWEDRSRFLALLAGTQGGKTTFAPWWLAREIEDTADMLGGANDYLAITATFDLFKLKFLPVMLECFEHVLGIGRYWASDRIIEISDPRTGEFWAHKSADRMWGRIILRAASAGSGLESATARGAVLDEAGQGDYTMETWEAVRRRLSLFGGRALMPTTVYNLGWLKEAIYDRAKRRNTEHEQPGDDEFGVENFDSIENPAFPLAEFENARNSMPRWRFEMMYRGLFTRPAGQIYDCFSDTDRTEGGNQMRGIVDRVARSLPPGWHRVAGIDFGVVNTCVGFYAVEEDEDGYPTGKLILHRTYHAGSRNATEHVGKLREIDPNLVLVTGGAASEDQWRQAYLWAGMPVYAPAVTEVEVGIDRTYGAINQRNLIVFDTEREWIKQVKDYSRELDERGEPTLKIKEKEKYHFLDQSRYLSILMFPPSPFLPFAPRRHLIVRNVAKAKLPSRWVRFGGMFYREGAPSSFVLCAVMDNGHVIVDREYTAPGLSAIEFANAVLKVMKDAAFCTKNQGQQIKQVRIAANPELFTKWDLAAVTGPSIAEMFLKMGITLVKSGGDGVNEWSSFMEWLRRGVLKINRVRCPFLSLTLPLIVSDPKESDKPDQRGPISAAQALCSALMLRPKPLPLSAPKKPGLIPDSKLPSALRSNPRGQSKPYE